MHNLHFLHSRDLQEKINFMPTKTTFFVTEWLLLQKHNSNNQFPKLKSFSFDDTKC